MKAKISVKGRKAFIQGVKALSSAEVVATDLRAGAGLVIAALGARGTTVVKNINFIDRGYEGFEKQLQKLGAKIIRVENNVEAMY